MPKNITEQQRNDIIKFYTEDKLTQAATARKVGCGINAVRDHLRRSGINLDTHRKGRMRRDVSEETRDEIVRLYRTRIGASAIARQLGLGDPTFVYAVLKQRGIPAHSTHGTKVPVGSTHITSEGYVSEKIDRSWKFYGKMAMQGGGGCWVHQHRKVMAEKLDRPLLKGEQVHHINGDRADNRPENLQLRNGGHGSGVRLRCRCCGSEDVEAVEV